ncbi:MAG: glutaredoxin [Eubacteriaceae bacterium]|nr:glutaredoxin [Eubacteriaceae bacterium]
MKKVTIYSADACPWCVRAKRLMDANDIKYDEIKLEFDSKEFDELVERTKMQTVPQIFFGDELIGGFPELQAIVDQGKFEEMIK